MIRTRSGSRPVLGIDLGSTWCKVAYVDRVGRFVAEGRAYSRLASGTGNLEQTWEIVARAVRAAGAERDSSHALAPDAIALSCRGVFGIGLDASGEFVPPPAIVSSASANSDLLEAFAAPGLAALDGYGYAPRLAASALRWKQREPLCWARVRRFGALHDWILYRLTGRWLTDPASGPGGPAWPLMMHELAGLPHGALPEIAAPDALAGCLRAEAAKDLALPPGIPVAVGSHDGAAANLGAGAFRIGDGCLTLGSNLVLRVVTSKPLAGCFGYPISEGRWAWVRGAHGIAAQFDAIVAALDGETGPVGAARHEALTRLAEAETPADEQHTPLQPFSKLVEAALTAQSQGQPAGMIYRAALEGAARAVRGLLDAACDAGASPHRLVVTGGAAENRLLLSTISRLLGRPLDLASPEAGLLGAAILAARAAGWYANLETAAVGMVPAPRQLCHTSAPRSSAEAAGDKPGE